MRLVRAPGRGPFSLSGLPADALVTVDVVAAALGVSTRQVRRLEGLPYVDLGPRSPRYRVSDVLGYIESRVRNAIAGRRF